MLTPEQAVDIWRKAFALRLRQRKEKLLVLSDPRSREKADLLQELIDEVLEQ